MPKYPANSEYEYLQWTIQVDCLAECDRIEELGLASDRAYMNGDDIEGERLENEYNAARSAIYKRRWRREEILDRLYIDTQLVQEGTTFADVWERDQPVDNEPF